MSSSKGFIDYFDRSQIVNLPARKDRKRETRLEFRKYGLPIETDTCGFYAATAPDELKGFPTLGTRGCYLSHLSIIEDAIQNGLDNVLVFEDDILFSKKIKEYGELAVGQLKELDWGIAYFGHSLNEEENNPHWRELRQPMMRAHFYAINGKVLEKLAKFLREIEARPAGHPDGGPMHYDGALSTFRECCPEINMYYYSKNLGAQRASKTDILESSMFDSNLIFRPFIGIARALKMRFARRYNF